jgi:hypothetical protein
MNTEIRWWVGWLVAFLAFPIGGALATAILGGLIAGGVLGLFQWLALRGRLNIGWWWIVATAAGLAVGVALGVAIFGAATTLEALIQRAIPAGLALGIAQSLVLLRHYRAGWLWIPAIAVLYPLGWFITTQVIGASVNQGFVVFGASGAITFQALTGLVLWVLMRTKASGTA